jgi:sulfite exporter TauE/SafE
MVLSEGLLLGLSTGAMCLAYCGPVIIPYLLAEGKNVRRSAYYLFLFLSGRMCAYIIVGFLVGILGTTLIQPSKLTIHVTGVIYMILATSLITYGFYQFREICLGNVQQKINPGFRKHFPAIVPVICGIATGLNICPPFLIAVTKAIGTGNISSSILFFMAFFAGSAIYFIPLPFTGFIKQRRVLRIIGKYAAILTGFIFLYQGTFMFLN